jgi:hypothetical protein
LLWTLFQGGLHEKYVVCRVNHPSRNRVNSSLQVAGGDRNFTQKAPKPETLKERSQAWALTRAVDGQRGSSVLNRGHKTETLIEKGGGGAMGEGGGRRTSSLRRGHKKTQLSRRQSRKRCAKALLKGGGWCTHSLLGELNCCCLDFVSSPFHA